MNSSEQRKSGALLSYISIFINATIQLLYTPLLIRMLGQSEYGLYSLVYSIIGYLTVLDLGFGNAIIVYTSKYRANKEYDKEKKLHGMFFMIFCIIAFIAGILGLILYFNVDNLFQNTMSSTEISKAKIMMLILTFNLIFTFIFNIFNSIISAYEKFIFQKVLVIIGNLLKPMIMIPLLFLGFKSISLCVVVTLVNLFILISNFIYCKNKLNISVRFKGFDKHLFKTIIGYSVWIFIGIIVDKVNYSADQFILGAVSGTIAVSIYSIASTIDQLFINLSVALSGVFLPKMSKLVAKKVSSNVLTDEFIKVGRLQYYIIFLICSGFVLFGKEFIKLWAGNNFEESYYVTLFLMIPGCIPLIQNLGLSIMQAMNKYKFKAISTIIMAFFNIIISIFLSKKYGAIGAAFGTGLALIICNGILINIYYKKEIKLNVFNFWKSIVLMTLKFFIPIIFILFIRNIYILRGIKYILFYGTIYVSCFCCISYFTIMNDYEKQLINSIFNKFKGVFKR